MNMRELLTTTSVAAFDTPPLFCVLGALFAADPAFDPRGKRGVDAARVTVKRNLDRKFR
jgi:hypothetical protein